MIIKINPSSAVPIYEQLYNQIVLGIAAEALEPGEVLPSVRSLGADLGINFHTVNKSYAALCDEGYIIMNRRQGAVVTKPPDGGGAFLSYLAEQITLSAAKAICRSIDKDRFMAMCEDCYQKAGGK